MPHWTRVGRYRDLAARAIEDAEKATDETVRNTCLRMAAGWHELAQAAEELAERLEYLSEPNSKSDQQQNWLRH